MADGAALIRPTVFVPGSDRKGVDGRVERDHDDGGDDERGAEFRLGAECVLVRGT
jgi:hypothetical protein